MQIHHFTSLEDNLFFSGTPGLRCAEQQSADDHPNENMSADVDSAAAVISSPGQPKMSCCY